METENPFAQCLYAGDGIKNGLFVKTFCNNKYAIFALPEDGMTCIVNAQKKILLKSEDIIDSCTKIDEKNGLFIVYYSSSKDKKYEKIVDDKFVEIFQATNFILPIKYTETGGVIIGSISGNYITSRECKITEIVKNPEGVIKNNPLFESQSYDEMADFWESIPFSGG